MKNSNRPPAKSQVETSALFSNRQKADDSVVHRRHSISSHVGALGGVAVVLVMAIFVFGHNAPPLTRSTGSQHRKGTDRKERAEILFSGQSLPIRTLRCALTIQKRCVGVGVGDRDALRSPYCTRDASRVILSPSVLVLVAHSIACAENLFGFGRTDAERNYLMELDEIIQSAKMRPPLRRHLPRVT